MMKNKALRAYEIACKEKLWIIKQNKGIQQKKSLIFYDCTAAQMDCVSKMFLRQNMQLIDIYMASTILRES